MNEIIHGYVVSVILTKFRINANIQLWQSFSILNFEIGIVSDFLQYINPWLDCLLLLYRPWVLNLTLANLKLHLHSVLEPPSAVHSNVLTVATRFQV